MNMENEDALVIMMMLLVYLLLEEINAGILLMTTIAFRKKRHEIIKVQNFYEVTVPQMIPRIFRQYFRMYAPTLANVVNYLSDNPRFQEPLCNSRIPLEKKIAMTCAYLGSKTTTLQMAYLFGVSEEAFLRTTELVIDSMIDNIHQIICWPTKQELPLIARQFNKIGRFFPNCIGAIDDMHLQIELTEERPNEGSYCNYKQWHSIHLQATTTYDLRFIHIFAGWPGRSHDGGVFKNSPLYNTLENLLHVPNRLLINSYHILGDSAFPCTKQLLTPYKEYGGQRLSQKERTFNKHLSSKRQNVEQSFSLLIRRFPRLHLLNQKTLKKKIKIVLAACMLHNICIMESDNVQFYLHKAAKKDYPRRHLYNNRGLVYRNNTTEGNYKRNMINRWIRRYRRHQCNQN